MYFIARTVYMPPLRVFYGFIVSRSHGSLVHHFDNDDHSCGLQRACGINTAYSDATGNSSPNNTINSDTGAADANSATDIGANCDNKTLGEADINADEPGRLGCTA
jgi:hypothetical protein